jgi:hypothetical protein
MATALSPTPGEWLVHGPEDPGSAQPVRGLSIPYLVGGENSGMVRSGGNPTLERGPPPMEMDDKRLWWAAVILIVAMIALAWRAGWFGGAPTAITSVPLPSSISTPSPPVAPAK